MTTLPTYYSALSSSSRTRNLNALNRSRLGGLIGVVSTIAIWWIAAETIFASVGARPDGSGGAIPTPPAVINQFMLDGAEFYYRISSITVFEAAIGFVWGNLLALALAAITLILPKLDSIGSQLAVITYCIPIVAIGPIVRLVVGAPKPGEPAGSAIVLAALSVFFTTYVGALAGVRATDRKMLDVVSAYGGGAWQRLVKVQLLSALPSIVAAFKIAAPAAFLGAILGQYVGGTDAGLGPAMVNAQQSLEVARVWGVALVAGALAGAGYLFFSLLGKWLTPWAEVSR